MYNGLNKQRHPRLTISHSYRWCKQDLTKPHEKVHEKKNPTLLSKGTLDLVTADADSKQTC